MQAPASLPLSPHSFPPPSPPLLCTSFLFLCIAVQRTTLPVRITPAAAGGSTSNEPGAVPVLYLMIERLALFTGGFPALGALSCPCSDMDQ